MFSCGIILFLWWAEHSYRLHCQQTATHNSSKWIGSSSTHPLRLSPLPPPPRPPSHALSPPFLPSHQPRPLSPSSQSVKNKRILLYQVYHSTYSDIQLYGNCSDFYILFLIHTENSKIPYQGFAILRFLHNQTFPRMFFFCKYFRCF